MAFRPLLRRQAILPIFAGAAAATVSFAPRASYAEAPERAHLQPRARKPIYDDPNDSSSPSANTAPREEPLSAPTLSASQGPTPTDRLAVHVRSARLQLHSLSSSAESSINSLLTDALQLEDSFTSTVASLGPPRGSPEQLVPGLVYVLVAGLAGSIVTRNRGIFLRLAVPVALGLGTGWAVIPVTMGNVSELAWRYERRYPELARTHLQIRERVVHLWETGKAHTGMTMQMAEEKVDEARKGVEGWVKKGN